MHIPCRNIGFQAAQQDKEAKVETARNLWVPGVNNHGGFGRWAYLEVLDPWDAKNLIRQFMQTLPASVAQAV